VIYFDATFLVRLYVNEPGYQEIRSLVADVDEIRSSILGKIETEAAFHRKVREGSFNQEALIKLNRQFAENQKEDLLVWLPLSETVIDRVHRAFLDLPSHVFLRAGDAIHLATASEAGFKEIYSNDRHLLAAAQLFKLKGINPLAK
jgi:predicted nucleic acid-binding protein